MPNYANAKGQKVSDFLGNHVSVKMWGAVGDGDTDDTAAIQAAINDLAATIGSGTATLIFPAGSYKVTSTLTWKRGVSLAGDYTCVGQPETWPRLLWDGPAGADFLVTDKLGYSIGMQTIKRLSLCKHPSAAQGPRDMVVYQDRCDQGTFIEEVQLSGAERYGLRYDQGGINVHLRQFRTDGIANAAIYWTESGNDLLSLDGFTVDNQRLDLAASGSALVVDGSEAPGNSYFHFGISNSRIEVNTTLPAGRGMFEFRVNTSYVAGIGNGGTGYALGDTGTMTGGAATYLVTGVGAGGVVTAATISTITGYTPGANYPTATGGAQPGLGIGLTLNTFDPTFGQPFPAMGNLVQMEGVFSNVDIEPASVANYTGILVTPATDYVQFVLIASRMTVSGVPSWQHPTTTNNFSHILSVISPFTLSAPAPYGSSEKTVIGMCCDVLVEKALTVLGQLTAATPLALRSPTGAVDLILDAGADSNGQHEPSVDFLQQGDYKYQMYVNWNGCLGIYENGQGWRLSWTKVTGALLQLGASFTTSNPNGDNTFTVDAAITLGVVVAAGLGYAIGDTGTVTGGTATYKVTAVGAGGAVAGVSLSTLDGYTPNSTYATATAGSQPGVGAGLTVQIASVTHYPCFNLSQGGNQLWQITMGWDGSFRIAQFAPAFTNRLTINTDGTLINSGPIAVQASSARLYSGAGSPEGVVTALVGSIYQRTDGGTGLCLYVKESGTGNTGWVLYTAAPDLSQYYTKAEIDALLLNKSSETHTHVFNAGSHHHTDPQGGNTGDATITGFSGAPQG